MGLEKKVGAALGAKRLNTWYKVWNSAFKYWCKHGKKFKYHGAAANMAARGVAVRREVLNAADNRFRIQIPMAGTMFPQYYFIKWSKMGFNASRMLFFQILYVPWIWTTKIWCSYAYFLHLIIIFNNLKSVCVTSENWNMDLKSQKLGFLARDKLRLSKKDIWCMFEHFFP